MEHFDFLRDEIDPNFARIVIGLARSVGFTAKSGDGGGSPQVPMDMFSETTRPHEGLLRERFACGFHLSAQLTKLLCGVGVDLYASDHALHDHALDRGTGCVSELMVSFHKGHLCHGCIGVI